MKFDCFLHCYQFPVLIHCIGIVYRLSVNDFCKSEINACISSFWPLTRHRVYPGKMVSSLALYNFGMSPRQIDHQLQCNQSTVSKIIRGNPQSRLHLNPSQSGRTRAVTARNNAYLGTFVWRRYHVTPRTAWADLELLLSPRDTFQVWWD